MLDNMVLIEWVTTDELANGFGMIGAGNPGSKWLEYLLGRWLLLTSWQMTGVFSLSLGRCLLLPSWQMVVLAP